MCEPTTLAIAAAMIGGGMYSQDRALRKSIKASSGYQNAAQVRNLGYENDARENIEESRDALGKDQFDIDLAENAARLAQMFSDGGQSSVGMDILDNKGGNQVVESAETQMLDAAAADNFAKANLQASLDSFGQTLVDANPLLEKSANAVNLASNFQRGELAALQAEQAYAQTKANDPLGQMLQIGGQIVLGNALAGGPTPTTPANPTLGQTGFPVPRPNYTPYSGS